MTKETLFADLTTKGDVLHVALSGEIDHHSAGAAREKIDAALFKYRPAAFSFDLSNVAFMDSSGLGLILGRVALCEELGISVRLLHPSPRVRKIFAVAGVDRIRNLTIEP